MKQKIFALLAIAALALSFEPFTANALTYNEIVQAQSRKVLEDTTPLPNPTPSPTTTPISKSPSSQAIISLRIPNGGESWVVGSTQSISWTNQLFVNTFAASTVKLEWVRNDGVSGIITESAPTNLGGSYNWTIGREVLPAGGSSAQLKIRATLLDAEDMSDGFFNVSVAAAKLPPPSVSTTSMVTLLTPNGGEQLVPTTSGGRPYVITWKNQLTESDIAGSLNQISTKLEWQRADGAAGTIKEKMPSGSGGGSYDWIIPWGFQPQGDGNNLGYFKIKVTIFGLPSGVISDLSDNQFFILYANQVKVNKPNITLQPGTTEQFTGTVNFTDGTVSHDFSISTSQVPVHVGIDVDGKYIEQIDSVTGKVILFGITGTSLSPAIYQIAAKTTSAPLNDFKGLASAQVVAAVERSASAGGGTGEFAIRGVLPFFPEGILPGVTYSYAGCPGDTSVVAGSVASRGSLLEAEYMTVDGISAPIATKGNAFVNDVQVSYLGFQIPANVTLDKIVPMVAHKDTQTVLESNAAYFRVLDAVACPVNSFENPTLKPLPLNSSIYNSKTSQTGAFATGSLVLDNGTVYLIAGSTKIPFTSWRAFVGLGYQPAQIVKGDTTAYSFPISYMISDPSSSHPWGSWLLYRRTVYYSTQSGMVPVPSWSIFLDNGGQSKLILPMNKADIKVLNSDRLELMISKDPRVQR